MDGGFSNARCLRIGFQERRGFYGVPEIVSFSTNISSSAVSLIVAQLGRERLSFCKSNASYVNRTLSNRDTRSIVVDYLQTNFKNQNVAIACIYCNYKEQTTQTISELIASLLKQLNQDRRSTMSVKRIKTFKFAGRHHDDHKTRPKLVDLVETLKSEIAMHSKVFIMVNALDECLESKQENLIQTLQALACTVNLMVTSRFLSSIELRLKDANTSIFG
jgi:hypothetical protein